MKPHPLLTLQLSIPAVTPSECAATGVAGDSDATQAVKMTAAVPSRNLPVIVEPPLESHEGAGAVIVACRQLNWALCT
jgi:hypothetical protein